MSNAVVAQCTHVKTNGEVCGSPAVSGTEFCYHHSAVKTALAKPHGKAPFEGFAPIPFVFPEDRASMQINFFLLLQAFNEQRIDQKTYRFMLSMLKAMAKNLGKTGTLVEKESSEPTSQKRDVGHPKPTITPEPWRLYFSRTLMTMEAYTSPGAIFNWCGVPAGMFTMSPFWIN